MEGGEASEVLFAVSVGLFLHSGVGGGGTFKKSLLSHGQRRSVLDHRQNVSQIAPKFPRP